MEAARPDPAGSSPAGTDDHAARARPGRAIARPGRATGRPGRVTAAVALLLVLLSGCGDDSADGGDVGIPNPASVYCEERGGRVDIRVDDQGGEYGVCVFDDGSECDEWEFYRGECEPAGGS